MKLTNLKVNNIFRKDEKFMILAGAGCSVDEPSCLPTGRTMMESIIKYICVESEIENILKLDDLRFESLVEIFQDHLDYKLKVIDYYGQCDKPNIQHFFLADMIKKGHFVITTNFDLLIEYALLQSNVHKDNIIPVITEEDYKKFNNPIELYNQGKKLVIKIHGSPFNLITKENTKDSLITTIRDLGKNKEGLNIFQIEPFKRGLIQKISNGRTLIVMGYSGNDDFDIVPTLKVLKNLRSVIWINHLNNFNDNEKIYEIEENNNNSFNDLTKAKKILMEIKRVNNVNHVYIVYTNTTNLIKKLIDSKPALSLDNFSLQPINWFNEHIKKPGILKKVYFPHKIFLDLNRYNDSLRNAEILLSIAEKLDKKLWQWVALNGITLIYFSLRNYDKALETHKRALQIAIELNDDSAKATTLSGMGDIFAEKGEFFKAIEKYKEVIKIDEKEGNLRGKANLLHNIGMLCEDHEKFLEALEFYEQALDIVEQLKNLRKKAIIFGSMANIYYYQKNYPDSLTRYNIALRIADDLGMLSNKALYLNGIGLIKLKQKKYSDSLELFHKAYQISIKLKDWKLKADTMWNIAGVNFELKNYHTTLTNLKEVFFIYNKIGLSKSPRMKKLINFINIVKRKTND